METTPQPPLGRYALVTSLGAMRHLDLDDLGSAEMADKHLTVEPGETRRLCDLEGPGRIVRIWFTTPIFGRRNILRNVVCRMYWDGEATPSVECPLGDLFGAAFGLPYPIVSERLVIAGGGYLCRFEMPFNERAIVEIENQSSAPFRHFFFQIGFYREPERRQDLQTFHAQWRRECPTVRGRPHRVLEARGKGRFVGLKLDVQNRAWWLRPPLGAMVIPRGFGLGLLEGWESIRVDAEIEPSVVGTGGEDYFSGGFYFAGGPFHTPTHGASVRSYLTGRASAYRFHIDDPIPFEQSIEISIDHGFRNTMDGDYASVAFWYQQEPHADFPALPLGPLRRVVPPFLNVLQHALLASVGVAALGVAALLVRAALALLGR